MTMRFNRFLTATISLGLVFMLAGCASQSQGVDAFKNYSAKQIYTQAENQLSKENFKVAIDRYEALDALYPFSPYAEKGQLHSIYAYYSNDDLASAQAAADRYIHLYPRSRNVDYAYYMKGITGMERNRTWIYHVFPLDPAKRDLSGYREAFSDFNRLLKFYPRSRYAADAQERMVFIRDILARHELEVAQFYFDRNAYVAAANRSSYIVEHLEGSAQVKPALEIMVKSYHALQKPGLERDAQRVLDRNYGVSA